MRVTDRAIVLQSIRYGDKRSIVKLFTAEHGLITVIASVGKSAGAKVRASTLLPLSLIDVQVILKQNKEIHQLTETACYFVSTGFGGAMNKLSIAQFLNEILIKSLKEQGPNRQLFDFVETCFKFLNDTQSDYINLHLYFLLELSKLLGFEPQNNLSGNEPYFDCREGRFTGFPLAFPLGLTTQDSKLFSQFLKMNILQSRFENRQRQNLLEILLAYYRLHVPGFNEVKSLEVLKALQI